MKLEGLIKYHERQKAKEDYEAKTKEKLKELKKEYEIALEENSTKAFILKCQIQVLEEILGG